MRIVAWLAAFALLPVSPAFAQGYPNKTVKIVAPVQPGGGVDLTARTVGSPGTELEFAL